MSIKGFFNQENLRERIEENKEFLVPIGAIFISIFLILFFILPGILSFPSKKSERDLELSKLNQIKEAKKILTAADPQALDSELDIASQALPSEKNFEIILNAISSAASGSNSQIDAYRFMDNENIVLNEGSLPELAFGIDVIGDINQASLFVDQLYKTYPVSEVKSIKYANGLSEVSVVFFYKPFTSVPATDAALARDKTPEEKTAMNEITKWNENSFIPGFSDGFGSGSSSGTRTSPF